MKTKQARGRVAKTLSLSMTPEQLTQLETRLARLSPMINGPSHYFRLLMQLDEKRGLIKNALGMEDDTNPFPEGFAC